jgi:3-isopropylmalate/(R)-2-methylmalate dehydratase small subunit
VTITSQKKGYGPSAVAHVAGTGLPLRGDDVDTDRIMPARFLRAVSFDGLEAHLFEDDRAADPAHPFGNPRYAGAQVLIVNANFGCGSSREHAPQALVRSGIRAVIGESFSEIFQGNATMLGLPCFTAEHDAIDRLQTLVERAPETMVDARVDTGIVAAGALTIAAALPAAVRDALLSGQWNPTAALLERYDDVRAVAQRLPYLNGF